MYEKKDRLNLFKSLSVPIMVVDADCRILDANLAAAAWTSLPNNRIIGRTCYQLTTGNTQPCWENDEVNCPIKLALESMKPARLIHQKKFGGRSIIEEVVATPIFSDKNEIDYLILELNDISELLNTKEVITYLKNEINTLRQIIPICASCKKIRDDDGFWQNVENYFSTRIDVQFSHSMCPECVKANHPEVCNINPILCSSDE